MNQPTADRSRSGITLLEVLISIGILSVGLASVVALLPAGGAQAKKAIVEDRRGSLGAAALADFINYGMHNTDLWSTVPTAPYRIVIDPRGAGTFPSTANLTAVNISGIGAGSVVGDLVFSAADDLLYVDDQSKPEPDTEPPVPKLTTGNTRRQSDGQFSWLATVVPADPAGSTQYHRVSIVEFYRRPQSPIALIQRYTGITGGGTNTLSASTSMSEDDFRALFPIGGALLFTDSAATHEWRRIQLAIPTVVAGLVTAVDVVVDRVVPIAATTLYAFEGAVGLVERNVQLEGTTPWTQ